MPNRGGVRNPVEAVAAIPNAEAIHRAKAASKEPIVSINILNCKLQHSPKTGETAFELVESTQTLLVFSSKRKSLFRAGTLALAYLSV